jgi:hypothetical protein
MMVMENLTVRLGSSGPAQMAQNSSWIPDWPWLLAMLLAYPFIQQYLRYQRLKAMEKKYNYPTRQDLAKMTDKEAWEIIANMAEFEFCTMFEKGMNLVLTGCDTTRC